MSLESFKKKLENLQGEYIFNFANEDDSAYLFEEFGGEERLKTKFPAVYQSYLKAREKALERMNSNEQTVTHRGRIGKIRASNPFGETNTGDDSYMKLEVPFDFSFIDGTKAVNSDEPAAQWKGITLQIQMKDINNPKKLINKSVAIPAANKYNGIVSCNPEKKSVLNNKTYKVQIDINGIDTEGVLNRIVMSDTQDLGNVEYYTISNIIIEDPAPKNTTHWNSKEIVMLYGRTGISNADYVGGDFFDNAFKVDKVHLLMPMKGRIIFNYNVEPIGLLEPTEGEPLTRSEATYDYKQQVFTYRNDIRDDKVLYNKMKECFKEENPYSPSLRSTVAFDIAIKETDRSKYDWHTDVSGIQDGNKKTIMLEGCFTYESMNQLGVNVKDQISFRSITQSDLVQRGGEYYKYVAGSNEVLIPPITIYWGCFGKDVKLVLADKTEKPAAEVKSGDKLLSYDNRILTVEDVLIGHDTEIFQIKTNNGGEIAVSGGHPMMCEGQFVRAHKIKPGDKLNLADGTLTEVVSNELIPYGDAVYNFTFKDEDEGTYIIANGFYTGDLKMQNTKEETPEYVFTAEEKALIAEMMLHHEEMKEKNRLL